LRGSSAGRTARTTLLPATETTTCTTALAEIARTRNTGIQADAAIDLLHLSLHGLPVELTGHHAIAKIRNLSLHLGMFRECRSHSFALLVRYFREIETAEPAALTLGLTLLLTLSLTLGSLTL
jgi:hypothetical protein